jgi:Ca-activated chloride channel family protein
MPVWVAWALLTPLAFMGAAAGVVAFSDAKNLAFDHPQLWWLGAAAPLAGLLTLYGVMRRRQAMFRFAAEPVAPLLATSVSPSRQAFRAGLVVAALVFLVAGLVGPRWGLYLEKQRVYGVDVVVAVDVSRSMLAADLRPNRLERIKTELRQQLTERGAFKNAHRLGLLAFAGSTSLRLPLTTDHVAFRNKLEGVRVGLVPRGGTAIAQAIRKAVDLFARSPQESTKIILLCTDGEDHEGGPVEEARVAWAEHGIRVYTVAVGDPASTAGAEVPEGPGQKPLLRNGQIVFSKLDLDGLRKIAEAGGGESALADDLRGIVDRIAGMRSTELSTEERMRHRPQYQWFIAAALLLLAVEGMIAETRRTRGHVIRRAWEAAT